MLEAFCRHGTQKWHMQVFQFTARPIEQNKCFVFLKEENNPVNLSRDIFKNMFTALTNTVCT